MKKLIVTLSAVLCVLLIIAVGCSVKLNETTAGSQGGPSNPSNIKDKTKVTELALVVTPENISQLEEYPNLQRVDLTGSSCYAEIAQYQAAHPDVEVIYSVRFGETEIKHNAQTATLQPQEGTFQQLQQLLQYLPKLVTLDLPGTELTADQLRQLQEGYDKVYFTYTVTIGEQTLQQDATTLDLSALDGSQAAQLAEKMALLPALTDVQLMKSDGSSNFSISDVKQLSAAAPNAAFQYEFQLFGKTVNASAEKVEFVNEDIGNEGEGQIRDALDILNKCTYFLLDNCGLDNEVLAEIRDDYPETKVVWRIYQTNQGRSWLTDTEVLRAVYGVNDTNSHVFKYCTEVKYMDFGHNTSMTDLSFISYMPNLELAILSGSPITDLTPLTNCKKLIFLELAWCGHLKDISPLAQCDSLIYLNVGHTKVKDFSPLYGMDLQMLSYVNSGNRVGFTAADWAFLQSKFPNCWITYDPLYDTNASPYGVGWRYKENWGGYTEVYAKIREVFDYDYLDSLIQGGAT